MALRHHHYETAFEEYLRQRRWPYVAVNEQQRSLWGGGSLKSLDFIVSPQLPAGPRGDTYLVDVKGRRFPSAGGQYWRNWSTQDELSSLAQWEAVFGPTFVGLLVFAYHIVGDQSPVSEELLFPHRGKLYAFLGVELSHYSGSARQISPKWKTVGLTSADFRHLARPLEELAPAAASCV